MRALLAITGVYHLALGFVAALAPRRFYEDLASYGAYSPHFIRDIATFYLAFGAVLLVATVRSSWREPVLALLVVQYALHVVNHVVDVAETDKSWQGPFNLVALAALTAGLWWLLRAVSGRPTARASRGSAAGPRRRPRGPSSRA